MKILAIDSSGMVASAAVLTEDKLIGEYTINNKKTHSQTLLPMIDTLMTMLEMEVKDVDMIAVASGPGSFTGLRIGSATAKGLAFASDKSIISVPTLEALAYNVYGTDKLICSMMDARNHQVFAALYHVNSKKYEVVMEQTPIEVNELMQKINEVGEAVVFVGDGAQVYQEVIENEVTVSYDFAPAHLNRQRASAVGMAAFRMATEGKIDTADSHVPEYLRLSQAEREYEERKMKEAMLKN